MELLGIEPLDTEQWPFPLQQNRDGPSSLLKPNLLLPGVFAGTLQQAGSTATG